MPRLLLPLWMVILNFSDNQRAQIIEYLREENKILRGKLPKRITFTEREKTRLVKYGKKLGSAIRSVVTVVSPRTFLRWVKNETDSGSKKEPKRKPGRPKTDIEVRDLILKIAWENSWGFTRILGELKKLGVRVSRTTVLNILREAGIDTGPKRGEGTWSDFLERHTKTLWASDFLSVKTLTTRGFVDIFVLFFIHPGTRKVIVSGITTNPDSAWMKQQARNVLMDMNDLGLPPLQLVIDLDTKYPKEFDAIFESEQTEIVRVGPKAPNLNAFAERFVQTLRQELLDHFIVCGEKHLRLLITEFVKHYDHDERPHQNLGNRPPCRQSAEILPFVKDQTIECRERLGGHLKHYHRQAA